MTSDLPLSNFPSDWHRIDNSLSSSKQSLRDLWSPCASHRHRALPAPTVNVHLLRSSLDPHRLPGATHPQAISARMPCTSMVLRARLHHQRMLYGRFRSDMVSGDKPAPLCEQRDDLRPRRRGKDNRSDGRLYFARIQRQPCRHCGLTRQRSDDGPRSRCYGCAWVRNHSHESESGPWRASTRKRV